MLSSLELCRRRGHLQAWQADPGAAQDSGAKVQLATASDVATDLVDTDKQSQQARQDEANKVHTLLGSPNASTAGSGGRGPCCSSGQRPSGLCQR